MGRPTGSRKAVRGVVVALALAAAACSPLYRDHGYVPLEEDLALITPGVDTRQTVADTIGTPSSGGVLRDSGYYYVSQRFRTVGPRQPEVISREIVAIDFDSEGVVRNIERYGLEDGNVVALSRRVTDSSVRDISILRQLLGNIGRFDAEQIFDEPS